MKSNKSMAAVLALSLMLAVFVGCQKTEEETEPQTDSIVETMPDADTEGDSDMEADTETEPEAETEPETEPPLPDEAERVDVEDTQAPETEPETDTETESETEAETEPEEPARIYHYLNGKTVTLEEQKKRPIAIMINNIQKCLPQAGITEGDMYYECSAEGGITRIMMLTTDYENLPEVGSVRSSRPYFLDFLANHEAIYIHAGGSDAAYFGIAERGINNLDGVNMYIPDMFWRDQVRWDTMGMEHSLMTNGPKIAAGIAFKKYSTTLPDTYVAPFQFYDEETDNQLSGSSASHIRMVSTYAQTVDFVYDKVTGEYLRYQYYGMPHVDSNNGEQVSVKNILILFTDISVIPGDTSGRLDVETLGEGQGYYITNGKRKVVNWSRENIEDPIHIEYRNGDELILNCGKTFICVVDTSVANKIDFEATW